MQIHSGHGTADQRQKTLESVQCYGKKGNFKGNKTETAEVVRNHAGERSYVT